MVPLPEVKVNDVRAVEWVPQCARGNGAPLLVTKNAEWVNCAGTGMPPSPHAPVVEITGEPTTSASRKLTVDGYDAEPAYVALPSHTLHLRAVPDETTNAVPDALEMCRSELTQATVVAPDHLWVQIAPQARPLSR